MIGEQTLKLSEIENEYEHYRSKTQTEIIQLRDKNETLQGKLDSLPNADGMLDSFKEQQFHMAEKDTEIERLKEDFK